MRLCYHVVYEVVLSCSVRGCVVMWCMRLCYHVVYEGVLLCGVLSCGV